MMWGAKGLNTEGDAAQKTPDLTKKNTLNMRHEDRNPEEAFSIARMFS